MSTFFTLKTQRLQHLTPYLQSTLAYELRVEMGQILSRMTANEKKVKALGSLPQYHSDGTRTVITADYDYMGRRVWKKVESITPNPETGEETTTVLLHHRYIYRGYLQIATCDLTRAAHPCLRLIIWEISRGLGGGLDKPKGFAPQGRGRNGVRPSQPIQWSSGYAATELDPVYYNYRYYNPADGR